MNPGTIKTGIRSNYLGEGSATHRIAETLIGALTQSPESYAKRIVPVLFTPDLDDRAEVLFNSKAEPILPSRGFDKVLAGRFIAASDALLQRASADQEHLKITLLGATRGSDKQAHPLRKAHGADNRRFEGMTGIEPAQSVWKTEALPLSYIPVRTTPRADCNGA